MEPMLIDVAAISSRFKVPRSETELFNLLKYLTTEIGELLMGFFSDTTVPDIRHKVSWIA